MKYQEIEGDLIKLAKEGAFDVITHGCNCFCRMKRGIAPQMAEAFGCDRFALEHANLEGDFNKLGQIDYETLFKEKDEFGGKWVKYPDEPVFMTGDVLTIINSYTQYQWGTESKPFDYDAFTLCMKKINHIFKGQHIGLPQIGSHLAGGDWNLIKLIIQEQLKDCKVTVVIYKL